MTACTPLERMLPRVIGAGRSRGGDITAFWRIVAARANAAHERIRPAARISRPPDRWRLPVLQRRVRRALVQSRTAGNAVSSAVLNVRFARAVERRARSGGG